MFFPRRQRWWFTKINNNWQMAFNKRLSAYRTCIRLSLIYSGLFYYWSASSHTLTLIWMTRLSRLSCSTCLASLTEILRHFVDLGKPATWTGQNTTCVSRTANPFNVIQDIPNLLWKIKIHYSAHKILPLPSSWPTQPHLIWDPC
jgi:hypothetical protein